MKTLKVCFIIGAIWGVFLVTSIFVRNAIVDGFTLWGFVFVLVWAVYLNIFGTKREFPKSINYAFHEKLNCDICGAITSKYLLNTFEPSPHGEKLDICRSCLLNKLREYLDEYECRAVVIYPMPEWGSYMFYSIDELIKDEEIGKHWVKDMKKFLPAAEAVCEVCNRPAHFNWCSPEFYNNKPFGKVKAAGSFSEQCLCSACLYNKLEEAIQNNDLTFLNFTPPMKEDGFCTSIGSQTFGMFG